jgi:uracil-DNA glycosylase
LAIDRFLGPLPLDQVIGKVHQLTVAGRAAECIPLPHPSGASSWIHGPGHMTLLDKALRELRHSFNELGVVSNRVSRRIA